MLKFYLPNFEDMVDPEFDFLNDTYSPKRKNRWLYDWYAHQFYKAPIFDGLLISKAVVRPIAEKRIRKAGNIHKFVELDPEISIMGDGGAFTYLSLELLKFRETNRAASVTPAAKRHLNTIQ